MRIGDGAAEDGRVVEEGTVAADAVAVQIVAEQNRERIAGGECHVACKLPSAGNPPHESPLPLEKREVIRS
jgi:hypothetical protein